MGKMASLYMQITHSDDSSEQWLSPTLKTPFEHDPKVTVEISCAGREIKTSYRDFSTDQLLYHSFSRNWFIHFDFLLNRRRPASFRHLQCRDAAGSMAQSSARHNWMNHLQISVNRDQREGCLYMANLYMPCQPRPLCRRIWRFSRQRKCWQWLSKPHLSSHMLAPSC